MALPILTTARRAARDRAEQVYSTKAQQCSRPPDPPVNGIALHQSKAEGQRLTVAVAATTMDEDGGDRLLAPSTRITCIESPR